MVAGSKLKKPSRSSLAAIKSFVMFVSLNFEINLLLICENRQYFHFDPTEDEIGKIRLQFDY